MFEAVGAILARSIGRADQDFGRLFLGPATPRAGGAEELVERIVAERLAHQAASLDGRNLRHVVAQQVLDALFQRQRWRTGNLSRRRAW